MPPEEEFFDSDSDGTLVASSVGGWTTPDGEIQTIQELLDPNNLEIYESSSLQKWRGRNLNEMFRPASRFSMSLNNPSKGLLNAPGENNCFLNSAVQVLWHLDVFRRSFKMLSGHTCMDHGKSCIFCALKVIFIQFEYSDQSVLPPDALRKALANTFQDEKRFQLGFMDDAAECFENILLRIHFHIANGESEDMCNARHCIPHQKFAMTIVEQIVCRCGATSEPLPFSQMVHYVSTSAFMGQVKKFSSRGPTPRPCDVFAQLIRNATSAGDARECPSNCKNGQVEIRRNLTNIPDVVSIGLIWDSACPSLEHIRDVVQNLGTRIRLSELFHSSNDRSPKDDLHLVGLVCYYGKHYSTFFFHSKARKWIYFDDATVREMDGRWDSVVDKCCRGHYQPLLLLYARQDPVPIDPRTSQQEVTMLSGDLSPPPNNNNTGNPGSARHHRTRLESSGGASGEKPLYNYETTLKGSSNIGEIGRNRRAMTPNPDTMSDRIDGNANRRAVTPGPEWSRYQSEDNPQDQGYGALHTRQSSYMLAVECTHPNKGLHHCDQQGPTAGRTVVPPQQKVRPQEKVGGSHYDYLPPPRKLSDAGRYERNNSAMDSYPSGNVPSQGVPYQNVTAHSMALDYHLNQKGNRLGPNTSNTTGASENVYPQTVYSGDNNTICNQTADWTLSNQDCYRRKAPVSPTKGMQEDKDNQFVYPTQPQSRVVSSVARVNELQKIDATRKGKAGPQTGVDVVRYQPVQDKPMNNTMYGNNRQHMDTMAAPLKRTSSMEDSKAPALYPGNARVRPSSARPYDYGNSRPGVDQRHRPVSAVGFDEFHHPQQTAPGQNDWQNTKDTSPEGDYISRKTVENIMKRQISRSRPQGGVEPMGHHHHEEYSKNTLKVEIPDNISLGSHRDSGYRSGSSGDRNSASSGSSTSVDSPTADPYRGCHQKEAYGRHVPTSMNQNMTYSSNESLSSSQSAQSNSSVRANQKLGNIPENLQAAQSGYQRDNRGMSNYPTHDIPEKPKTAPPPVPMKVHPQSGFMTHEDNGKNPADQHCEMLCMKSEDLMALSGQKERQGDLALALILCTQALGHLQNAMNVKDITQETRVYTKMKHSTCVLKSRSLHKRIMTRQDSNVSGSDISNEDHVSISSVSTDQDFPPPPEDLMTFTSTEDPEHQQFKDHVKTLYDQGIHCPNKMDGSKKMVPPPYSYAMQYSRTDSGYDSQSSTGSNSQGQYATTGAVRNKQLIHGSAVTNLTTTQSTSLESITSDLSNMEIYGTLPRKVIQKALRRPSVPDARDMEVYNAYIHTQRQQDKQSNNRYPNEQNSQKIDKNAIRNMLLEDYVNKGTQKWNGYQDEKMQMSGHQEHTERTSDFYGAPNDPRNQQAGNTHYYDSQAGHWVSDCVNSHSRQSSSSSSMGNHSRQDSSSSQNTVIHVRQPNTKSLVPPAPPRVSSQLSHHLPPPDPVLLNEARNFQRDWEQQSYQDQTSNSITNNLNLMQSQKLQTSKKEKDWSKVPRPLRPKMKKSSSHGNISSFGIDNTGSDDKTSLNSFKDGYGSDPKEFAAKLSHSQSAILDPQTAPPVGRDLTLPADFKVPLPQVKKDKPKERDLLKKYHFDEESDAGEGKKKPKPKPKPSPPKRPDVTARSPAKTIPQFQDTLSQPLTCINVQERKQQQQQESNSEAGVSDLIQKWNRRQSDNGIDFNKDCEDNRGNPSFQKACVSDLFNTKKPLSGSKSVENVAKKAVDDLDGCPMPKSAIKKGRSRQRSKTVTFSENIALIVSVDEQPEEIDYMAYVQSVLQHKEKMKSPLTKRKLEQLHKDKSQEPDAKLDSPKLTLKSAAEQVKAAGYDSDFDEDTSESDNEDGSKKIRCSLCRKKMINSTEQYCQGCTFYMSKFQPVS